MEREEGGGRRLLVTADEGWHNDTRPRTGLQSLGDDEQFMEAIFNGMLPQTEVIHEEPPEPGESQRDESILIEDWPFSSIGSVESETESESESGSEVEESETPRGSEGSTVSIDEYPSAITEVDTLEDAVPFVDVMYLHAPGPSNVPEPPSAPAEDNISPLDAPGPSSLPPGTEYAPSAPPLPATLPYRDCGDMGGSPLGQWPHGLSSMMASLACTLGIFNISRFAVLSVQFGANFIVQFLVMSLILGIPLFTFHVSLGQLLGSGAMDMWRISPIFQGIGIALILSQALLGIYSIVGVSWMYVYFRDSFITKQDTYRWSEPYDIILGQNWKTNTTIKLEETVSNYFSAVVLQRSNLETPANAPGHLKFQVTFNLAVVWMIVFISLSKGLKSYGKVVFLFSLAPTFGMLVLCTKLLGLAPQGSKIQLGFPQSEWGEFFSNTKSWSAAMCEAFYTWGLLGAAAMQMASHNRPKHHLHRDTSFVTVITLVVLILAAFLANTCSQLLYYHGYTYIPSSFEKMSSYGFLHPIKGPPLLASMVSTPPRFYQRSLFQVGERVIRPAVNTRQQSGYQALRLATELVPATLAVLGPGKLSPFWSVLFYFVLILFGIAQQLAIMHCVITGIMAIKVKTMKSWETTITFFTCVCGFILGLPMATELGIFVVYFLDYTVGGGWWIMLLYLIELIAVFMVRGRPYSGETVVATLFAHAGRFLQEWAAPILSFVWNVVLPVMLMVLCISVFKNGNYREVLRLGGVLNYDYWPAWSRQVGALIQLVPLLAIPFIGIVQSCRYLSSGPPDVFDRIQLLYRPPEEAMSPSPIDTVDPANADPETGNPNSTTPQNNTVEDPPPKYTPPPSYSTATGARIAKLMRQSFRRSVRRIQTAFAGGGGGGSGGGSGSGVGEGSSSEPPPPDYDTVLVEIHQSLSSDTGPTTSSTLATVSEVASRLRSSFRRAMSSQSQQCLVPSASPIHRDSIILEDKRVD
ncbi:sodium-dependent transporter bedraggled isoform X2 [Halyomorpha halys]|uniref:sodium-dependent transporter bedraggled isoform X2 n=1 Tax=Halyomorpha halys TaxID=286706 RepID=UPI0006D4E215